MLIFLHVQRNFRVLYQQELQNEGRKPYVQTRERRDIKPLLKQLQNTAALSQTLNRRLQGCLSPYLPLSLPASTCWQGVLPSSQPGMLHGP